MEEAALHLKCPKGRNKGADALIKGANAIEGAELI